MTPVTEFSDCSRELPDPLGALKSGMGKKHERDGSGRQFVLANIHLMTMGERAARIVRDVIVDLDKNAREAVYPHLERCRLSRVLLRSQVSFAIGDWRA